MDNDDICKRYHLCDDDRHSICKARDIGMQRPRAFTRSQAGCLHKYTRTAPTQDRVIIDGEERKVIEVICKECGFTRRMVL